MSIIRVSDSKITSFGPLTINGNLDVDSNTLFVDAINNYIGIGTNNPNYPLEVAGAIKSSTNAKVWINFEPGISPNIRSNYGVSSISRISDGRYTINFTSSFNNANYVVIGCSQRNGIDGNSRITVIGSAPDYPLPANNMTTTYVNIETGFSTVSAAADIFMASIAIFATS